MISSTPHYIVHFIVNISYNNVVAILFYLHFVRCDLGIYFDYGLQIPVSSEYGVLYALFISIDGNIHEVFLKLIDYCMGICVM